MKHLFEEKIAALIEREGLLTPGAKVIVALSGGADSVALLSAMTALGYGCIAAHCDYHLRGNESERDREHARAMAARHGARYVERHFDAASYCAARGVSTEMGCRELRYQWFAELSRANGGIAVAVGHHSDDNVETLMLNLLRGTGLTGLTAMKPRNGLILRPMLDVSRREVLDYLADKQLTYVTDSTNLLNDVKRNRLRNVLLPAIRAYFPDATATLTRSIRNLTSDLLLYTELIERVAGDYRGPGGAIDVARLCAEVGCAATLLFEMLRGHGFNAEQCAAIAANAGATEARRFYAREYVALLSRGALTVRTALPNAGSATESYRLLPDEPSTWPEGFTIERIDASEAQFDRSATTLFVDCDKLGDRALTVRRWKHSDRIDPYGMKGSRLVSNLFSDAHFTPDDKARAWILTAAGQVVWVVGLRTSRHLTLTPRSRSALRIAYVPPTQPPQPPQPSL